jgi:hypothetical protein
MRMRTSSADLQSAVPPICNRPPRAHKGSQPIPTLPHAHASPFCPAAATARFYAFLRRLRVFPPRKNRTTPIRKIFPSIPHFPHFSSLKEPETLQSSPTTPSRRFAAFSLILTTKTPPPHRRQHFKTIPLSFPRVPIPPFSPSRFRIVSIVSKKLRPPAQNRLPTKSH